MTPVELLLPALKTVTFEELAKIEAVLSPNQSDRQYHPETISSKTISQLGPVGKKWALLNVKSERLRRLQEQIFRPGKEELLIDWMNDGKRYTKGDRLEANNYEMHPQNNQRWMTDQAYSVIRHIIFTFKIPTRRFGSLMACFSVLLLGRPTPKEAFPDRRGLNRRLLRLSIFDWHRMMVNFETFIVTPTLHGFLRYWYSITDDSKHFKLDRHAVMMTILD